MDIVLIIVKKELEELMDVTDSPAAQNQLGGIPGHDAPNPDYRLTAFIPRWITR